MYQRAENEGFRVLDDFVCDAIPAPAVPQAPPNKRTGKQFDVTTPDARKQALQEILGWYHSYWWVSLPFPFFREGWMLWKLASLYSTESTTKEVESQRKTAVEIIRAGKASNVDELEITLSEQAGIGLGSNVEGFPIEFNAGTQGKMTIKVKYK